MLKKFTVKCAGCGKSMKTAHPKANVYCACLSAEFKKLRDGGHFKKVKK